MLLLFPADSPSMSPGWMVKSRSLKDLPNSRMRPIALEEQLVSRASIAKMTYHCVSNILY